MKRNIFLILVIIVTGWAGAQTKTPGELFEDLFENAPLFPHCLSIKADFAYNGWLPNESYALDYYTEGIQYFKFDARFTHKIPFLPELKFAWETNFTENNNQEELLAAHAKESDIEKAYNKILFIAGFGKRLDYFNPYRSNSFFELSYLKETFYISVSPNSDGLYYVPYSGDYAYSLSSGQPLSMVTTFEEIQGTFKTPNIGIFPVLFSVLFLQDTYEMFEFDEQWETRLGAYYARFQKPYMITQIETYGNTSGYADCIYEAKFNAIGLVEKYSYYNKWFDFDMQLNLGVAWIKLNENEFLQDSSSPIFFHMKMAPNVGVHFSFLKSRVSLGIKAGLDWGFMVGGSYNAETEKFDTNSFLNDDVIFKMTASMAVNL